MSSVLSIDPTLRYTDGYISPSSPNSQNGGSTIIPSRIGAAKKDTKSGAGPCFKLRDTFIHAPKFFSAKNRLG